MLPVDDFRTLDPFVLRAATVSILALSALIPTAAFAQEGINDSDLIQENDTDPEQAQENPAVVNQRDALVNRPDPNLTTEPVPQDKKKKSAREIEERVGEDIDAVIINEYGEESQVSVRASVVTRVVARDNLDFREINETSRQSIIDTDDRLVFGANQARFGIEYRPSDYASVSLGLGHNGLWGGDSLKSVVNTNTLFIDNLFFTWSPVRTPQLRVDVRLGRQYYEIGGALNLGGQRRDYFLWDVVDGLTIDADLNEAGKFRLLGVDFVGLQFRPDEVDFVTRRTTSSSDLNQRGDTTTYRFGGVYENTRAIPGVEVRAFGYMAHIGGGDLASSTGSDRCYGAGLCNVPDNDYNWMAGARAGYFFTSPDQRIHVGGYGEFARSGGVDRKDTRVGLFDVSADGNAFGGALEGNLRLGQLILDLGLQYFRADGSNYASVNGAQFSHGFVAFKGAQIGGVAINDNAGWHPSAYIGSSEGVENFAQDQVRKSGTQSIFAGVGIGVIDLLKLDLGLWLLKDTGQTLVSADRVDVVSQNLPFGFGAEDIAAQQRLGKDLGVETDVGLTLLVSPEISIFSQLGLFFPGEFYEQEISRQGGTALGSSDNLQTYWVATTGMSLSFD